MSEETVYAESNRVFSGDQKLKITQIINEGMQVMHEMDTLREGLSDTVKAVAEELQIKPSILKKAIRIAHKASLNEENKNHDVVNNILQVAGKTL